MARLLATALGVAALLVRASHAADESPQANKAAPAIAHEAADPLDFQQARPLLEKHCFACHGDKKQEGGVNFSALSDVASILSQRALWHKAQAALAGEEMPPEPEKTGFSAADRARLTNWIENRVEKIDPASPIYLDPGPPLVRQFTRAEYERTMRELLRIDFDPASAAGIAEEQTATGYANLAGSQLITEPLMEKYFAAAEAALDYLFTADVKRSWRLKGARESLFAARPGAQLSAHAAAAQCLGPFLRRAYRRPLQEGELDRVLAIADRALQQGDSFDLAVRKAMKPVLVSPYFLYSLETDQRPPGSHEAYPITDHELAVRLSYFLWASMPDDALFTLADENVLSQPDVLRWQVQRMLADPKAYALTDYFGMQWLQLQRLHRALPSKDFFPALTGSLKNDMEQETRHFFDALRTKDHRVLDLLDANYTYANAELAQFYGLRLSPDKKPLGNDFEEVALRPEDHRGGLLAMSSILTLTSHTDRTKPTSRGKWILEVLLGTPPPPPPANVSQLTTPKGHAEPKTFREKLALHASEASCAACHKRIDPLGFALENYDAIGAWREQVAGAPVDNAGRLPGEEAFHGPDGLKRILHARQDQFVRNFTVQLLTYALGRNIEYYDEAAVAEIDQELARQDYRFSALVLGVVNSRPFRYRRNLGSP
ncbi:MAG TPA: DUF1592 domain-containing protein [Pirellulales bacterium]|nr:DUF1592 domain-containing protein [Pirellulales bacterium]